VRIQATVSHIEQVWWDFQNPDRHRMNKYMCVCAHAYSEGATLTAQHVVTF